MEIFRNHFCFVFLLAIPTKNRLFPNRQGEVGEDLPAAELGLHGQVAAGILEDFLDLIHIMQMIINHLTNMVETDPQMSQGT